MTEFVFSNFAFARIKSRVETNETIITVDAEEVLTFAQPAGGQVQRCVVRDDSQDPEIIDITSNPFTGNLVVARGLEGTAAKQWDAGSIIEQIISAGMLSELEALKP